MRVCVFIQFYTFINYVHMCVYIYIHTTLYYYMCMYIYTVRIYNIYIYIQYMHIDSISREWVYTFEHPDAHNLSKEQNHVPWHRHAFPSAWRLGEGQRHRSTDSPMGCEGSCKRPRLKPIRMQIAGVPSADRFDEKPKMNRNCRKDLGKGLGWNMELL